jgi:hypothetical protein
MPCVNITRLKKVEWYSLQFSPGFEIALLLEKLQPSLVVLPVKDNCGALLKLYWQAKTEIIGEKPDPVPLCTPPTCPTATLLTTNLSQCHSAHHQPVPVPLFPPPTCPSATLPTTTLPQWHCTYHLPGLSFCLPAFDGLSHVFHFDTWFCDSGFYQ